MFIATFRQLQLSWGKALIHRALAGSLVRLRSISVMLCIPNYLSPDHKLSRFIIHLICTIISTSRRTEVYSESDELRKKLNHWAFGNLSNFAARQGLEYQFGYQISTIRSTYNFQGHC